MKSPMAQIPPMKKGITFYSNPLKSFGGEGEIRTPGGVTHTRFPIVLLRPARTPLHKLFPALGTNISIPVCCRVQALCAAQKTAARADRLFGLGMPKRTCSPQMFALAAFRRRIAFFPPFQMRHIGRAGATMGKGRPLGAFPYQPGQADHKPDNENAPEHGGSIHDQGLRGAPHRGYPFRAVIPSPCSCRPQGVSGGCACLCGRSPPVGMPRARRWRERQCRWH